MQHPALTQNDCKSCVSNVLLDSALMPGPTDPSARYRLCAQKPNETGFTLLELLIVIAIVGTLSAIGITNIPRDRFQVREATRVISADINRARSEAIRLNTEVELRFNIASDCYTLSETKDQNKTVLSTPRRILERCIKADFPLADVSEAVFSAIPAVSFNSRGLPTNALGGSVTVRSRGRSSYALQVVMASQGRLRVQ